MIFFFLSACILEKNIYYDSADDSCATLNYANFGQAFLTQYCSSCHNTQSYDRKGAPEDITLDTESNIDQYSAVILLSLSQKSMPPQDGIPSDIRNTAIEWLKCRTEQ